MPVNKSTVMQYATLGVPVLALVIGGVGFTTQHRRLGGLEADLKKAETEYAAIKKLVAEMESQKGISRFPTVAITPREQPIFLTTLRTYADLSGVKLIKWGGAPVPAITRGPQPNGKKDPNALPDGVSAIANQVEISGNYQGVRGFLYNVLRIPRLINLNDVKWARGAKGQPTTLTFTVTRYVAPLGKASTEDMPDPFQRSADTPVQVSVDPAGQARNTSGTGSVSVQTFRQGSVYSPASVTMPPASSPGVNAPDLDPKTHPHLHTIPGPRRVKP
jgi:hypothetical protein